MKQPLIRQHGIVVQELPDEVLVYDTINDRAHCLNQTAALVWKYCDGKHAVGDIVKILSRELNAPVKEEFVWLALDQLEKESLLEAEKDFSLKSTLGVSRREAVKRIGLASLVALPIVTSLLNPLSAHAGNQCTDTPCFDGTNPNPAICTPRPPNGAVPCSTCTSNGLCS